jgi:hypothetical protein
MVNIEQILRDYGISYDLTVNPGWANINCPFCGDRSNHLGFNLQGGYCHCWKCGGHHLDTVLRKLLHLTPQACEELLTNYTAEHLVRHKLNRREAKATELVLPGDELNDMERRYLEKRGFDPDFLVKKYGIQGGGITGRWKFRIIIPLFLNHRLVSFTARDITGKQPERYKNLSIEESIVDPKTTFYNLDNAHGKRVCLIEGPTDVWRMGDGFICSFGTSVTQAQLKQLSQGFQEIFIMFDPEPVAQKKAQVYAQGLAVLGSVDVWIVDMEYSCDPGALTDKQAMKLRRELGFS